MFAFGIRCLESGKWSRGMPHHSGAWIHYSGIIVASQGTAYKTPIGLARIHSSFLQDTLAAGPQLFDCMRKTALWAKTKCINAAILWLPPIPNFLGATMEWITARLCEAWSPGWILGQLTISDHIDTVASVPYWPIPTAQQTEMRYNWKHWTEDFWDSKLILKADPQAVFSLAFNVR